MEKAVETPRQLVSVQASIYNPLGFLSPFCLLGRKLLQQATSGSPGCDSKLKPVVKEEFRKWAMSIVQLCQLTIPRCFTSTGTMDAAVIELHIFCHASPQDLAPLASEWNGMKMATFSSTSSCQGAMLSLSTRQRRRTITPSLVSNSSPWKRECKLTTPSSTLWRFPFLEW